MLLIIESIEIQDLITQYRLDYENYLCDMRDDSVVKPVTDVVDAAGVIKQLLKDIDAFEVCEKTHIPAMVELIELLNKAGLMPSSIESATGLIENVFVLEIKNVHN